MAQSKTTIQIDSVKLKKLIQAYCAGKGIKVVQLSRQLGFSDSYFSDVWERGSIRQFVIVWLERECNIKYDDYKLKPVETKKLTKEETDEYISKMETPKELSEISKKLDDLTMAINKLGNIQMQQLEYLKEIKDMLK